MARSTAGSPTIFNMPNASSAAAKPTTMPRHNKDPVVIMMILKGDRRAHERFAAGLEANVFPQMSAPDP